MKLPLLFIAFLVIAGCRREPDAKNVITAMTISPTETLADGQSIVSVSVVIDPNSSEDRKNILFSTTNGTFSGSGNTKDTIKATFENGILTAKAAIRSPLAPSVLTITAQPVFDSPLKDIILKDSAVAKFSEPDTIFLTPSASGIASSHLTEVRLTGFLRNDQGNFVSNGVRVIWEDVLVSGLPALGTFRELQTITKDSSKVNAFYSAPALSIGTIIKIRLTIVDGEGKATNKKDSIYLTVNQ